MISLAEFKDNILDAFRIWIEERVDSLAESNPRLKVASVYLKRGARNYISRERGEISGMIDNVSLFLCDENGNIDTDMLLDDLMQMFRDMEEVPFGAGLVRGTFGNGAIRFVLPDNPVINLLFGDIGAIKITDSDLLELKNLLSQM